MTDLETAKTNLKNHSICLCKDGKFFFDDRRGISPLMSFISESRDLSGYSVADVVVGKAAAFLMIKCGIKNVFAKVLSKPAATLLSSFSIPFEYETLTEKIINRDGTDICPMEKTVLNTDSPDVAYKLLSEKLAAMRN